MCSGVGWGAGRGSIGGAAHPKCCSEQWQAGRQAVYFQTQLQGVPPPPFPPRPHTLVSPAQKARGGRRLRPLRVTCSSSRKAGRQAAGIDVSREGRVAGYTWAGSHHLGPENCAYETRCSIQNRAFRLNSPRAPLPAPATWQRWQRQRQKWDATVAASAPRHPPAHPPPPAPADSSASGSRRQHRQQRCGPPWPAASLASRPGGQPLTQAAFPRPACRRYPCPCPCPCLCRLLYAAAVAPGAAGPPRPPPIHCCCCCCYCCCCRRLSLLEQTAEAPPLQQLPSAPHQPALVEAVAAP